MTCYCLVAVASIDRLGTLRGSIVALGVWIAVAAAGYFLFLAR